MNFDLREIAADIRNQIEKRKKELDLAFYEEEHIYHMRDNNGMMRDNYLSVSKIIKKFYEQFDSQGISLRIAKGDIEKQKKILEEWKNAGEYSANMGSRVHFELEKELINRYQNYKEVRVPIFNIDEAQQQRSDSMIKAGTSFLNLMEERNATLIDTEMVLGDPDLGYVGQPDKIWLMLNKEKNGYGVVITDWKTNQPKNFESQYYTKKMYAPFQKYDSTALTHYYLQLPLYGKLFFKMLEKTKYKNLSLLGCVIVLLMDDGNYKEYKVPSEINQQILNLDIKKFLTK